MPKVIDDRVSLDLILAIADRAWPMYEAAGETKLALIMDLDHVHRICPLDLQGLLAAPPFDFSHDIVGIYRHFNRETKTIGGGFMPRTALP